MPHQLCDTLPCSQLQFAKCLLHRSSCLFPEPRNSRTLCSLSLAVARHRPLMILNGKAPRKDFENCFVAPNASVVGDVDLVDMTTIWYGAVLRGDKSSIHVGGLSSVGDKTVINTVAKLSTGFPAKVVIGNYVVIEEGCSLTSCMVGDQCNIGRGSVVCEGAIMEKQSILLPGSVLTTGSLVPSRQIWGGNPAQYVGDVDSDSVANFKDEAERQFLLSEEHVNEFNPANMAFTHAEDLAKKGITV
ncbi:trimeric LpxA-like protein [Tribonema minus]|uniref:Trimeric LpxA-like protein n=1 Tax=Tribonema minus TaxID=303371 RepID=A0A835YZE2_9STRA|nr:trimeric LpxA-like protein [Tribonema minus]